MGYDVSGTYIISSDESKNYQCDNSLLSDLKNSISEYCHSEDYDYFVVVRDYCGYYAVVCDKNDSDFVAAYPEDKIYRANGNLEDCDLSSYSYEALYQICLEEL